MANRRTNNTHVDYSSANHVCADGNQILIRIEEAIAEWCRLNPKVKTQLHIDPIICNVLVDAYALRAYAYAQDPLKIPVAVKENVDAASVQYIVFNKHGRYIRTCESPRPIVRRTASA